SRCADARRRAARAAVAAQGEAEGPASPCQSRQADATAPPTIAKLPRFGRYSSQYGAYLMALSLRFALTTPGRAIIALEADDLRVAMQATDDTDALGDL